MNGNHALYLVKDADHEPNPRYRVLDESQSCHCCFVATVLDMSKPEIMHGEHYRGSGGFLHYHTVCETFDDESALLIAESLNRTESTTQGVQE